MRRPPASYLLLAVSALLAAGALVIWMLQEDREVGPTTEIEESLRPTTTLPMAEATTSVARPPVVEANEVNRLDGLTDQHPAAPVRLVIPALGVDAPIEPFGVDARTGQMAVPRNVTDVAWYKHGPVPGEGGSAVLAAHVDLIGRGPGVFFRLRDLEPRDEIVVGNAEGVEAKFVVVARTLYDKEELPLDTIFATSGAPVLTLVTCGGGFDSSRQSYEGNVVVYAVPAVSVPVDPYSDTGAHSWPFEG